MALISAKTIITSISLFHITLAYFFLTNPNTVDDQVLVWVMGESMGMVRRHAAFRDGSSSAPRPCNRGLIARNFHGDI